MYAWEHRNSSLWSWFGWFLIHVIAMICLIETSRKRQNFTLPTPPRKKTPPWLFRNTDRQRALPHPSLCGSARKPIALTKSIDARSTSDQGCRFVFSKLKKKRSKTIRHRYSTYIEILDIGEFSRVSSAAWWNEPKIYSPVILPNPD